MASPSQKYLRNLRENPDWRLVAFIDRLKPGSYTVFELWKQFNNGGGYWGQFAVFRYAALHAGLVEETPNGKLVKP